MGLFPLSIRTSGEGPLLSIVLSEQPSGGPLLLVGAKDRFICRWDSVTGELLWRLDNQETTYRDYCLVQLAENTILVLATDWGIERCDALIGEPLPVNPDHVDELDEIWSVAAGELPDGRMIIAGACEDALVYRWDARTQEPIEPPLAGHERSVVEVVVVELPNDQVMIASASEDGTVRRWNAVTGDPIGEPLRASDSEADLSGCITSLGLPTGQALLAAADTEGAVYFWDAATGSSIGPPIRTREHLVKKMVVLEWNADGVIREEYMYPMIQAHLVLVNGNPRLLATADGEQIRHWDVASGTYLGAGRVADIAAITTLSNGEPMIAIGDFDSGDVVIMPLLDALP